MNPHYVTAMTQPSFAAVINLLRAHALIEERLSRGLSPIHGLALNEALLLMHLERAPGHRLTRIDLARRLHLNPSTVTRMCLPLEKTGFVTRESDPRDARLAYVVLTDTGRTVIGEVRTTLDKSSEEVFRDRWTEAELASLNSLVGRLTAAEPGDLV
ncbi:hypothetical protein BH09PSE2_BH09PSE2_01270 [soil metagenome]